MAEDTKTYLPQQHVKRGKAGYRGKDIMVVGDNGKAKAAPVKRKGAPAADED